MGQGKQFNYIKCVSIVSLCFVLMCSLFTLAGCSSGGATRNLTMDVTDYAMNLLEDCDVEVTNPDSQHATFWAKYMDHQVANHHLNMPYDEWAEKGMPASGVDYSVYFIYDSTGENHVLLYDDGEDQIMEFAIYERDGDFAADLWMDRQGRFLTKNPINGDVRTEKENKALSNLGFDPYSYASKVYYSLDYDYLAKLDPSTSVPRSSDYSIPQGFFGSGTGL